MTAAVNIDDLVNGAATGDYPRKVGSQFGSIWGWDGLLAAEATLEQYQAFGAGWPVRLCHGHPVAWLEREWAANLVYSREKLAQVNVHHNNPDAATFVAVRNRLDALAGEGREVTMPKDASLGVTRRLRWEGRDGVVTLVQTATYLQVSVGRYTRMRRVVNWALRSLGMAG
jgi:hypothetical protein